MSSKPVCRTRQRVSILAACQRIARQAQEAETVREQSNVAHSRSSREQPCSRPFFPAAKERDHRWVHSRREPKESCSTLPVRLAQPPRTAARRRTKKPTGYAWRGVPCSAT